MYPHVTLEQRVAQHYGRPGLERTILEALVAAGKDVDRLAPDDLAPIDEFHTGGRQATVEFAAQTPFASDAHVLDVGCGIGGPSRFFAERYGCRVTGVDITSDYVDTARALARRVGLADRVEYRQASALALPFEERTFDGAYMMHVGMNVADKRALFAEVRRVLKEGAPFGIYDVLLTGRGELTFPLPCAATPETSFVVGAQEYRAALEAAGFHIEKERDRLEVARAFFRQELARADRGASSPLGIHLLMKEDAPRVLANVVKLFEAGVITPVEIFCRAAGASSPGSGGPGS